MAKLKLDQNKVLRENPNLRGKVISLIEEYLHIFSSPDEIYGHMDLREFDIELKEGTKPSKAHCCPLNPKGLTRVVGERRGDKRVPLALGFPARRKGVRLGGPWTIGCSMP